MSRTADAVFKIVEDAGEYLWLKEIEGQGKGLQVAVPKRHEAYDDALQGRIRRLEPGAIIDATLRSTNEKNTAWRFDGFHEETTEPSDHPDDHDASPEVPADD